MFDAAVVLAFVVSTSSTQYAPTPQPSTPEAWTYQQVICWMGTTVDLALEAEDRRQGAKVVWREWALAERRFPQELRTQLVRWLDDKLRSKGYPRLRELVS